MTIYDNSPLEIGDEYADKGFLGWLRRLLGVPGYEGVMHIAKYHALELAPKFNPDGTRADGLDKRLDELTEQVRRLTERNKFMAARLEARKRDIQGLAGTLGGLLERVSANEADLAHLRNYLAGYCGNDGLAHFPPE